MLLSCTLKRGIFALALSSFLWTGNSLVFAQDDQRREPVVPASPPERLPQPDQPAGVEPLTKGEIHEAFGQPITFDPQPGIVVPKKPPANVNELPPDQKPAGDNVAWIPGYWGWDQDRQDFIWISGFWRNVPPERQWIPGYWSQVQDGYQWVSGYWASADTQNITYLPQPPENIDNGPSTEAPAADYVWSPGYWAWQDSRYLWRPGYWVAPQVGWMWVAPHYRWCPSGYVFNDGYWDYGLTRRGLLFSPAYLDPSVYLASNFYYTPSVFLDVNLLVDQLFCWPRYHHYCFGDFYAGTYAGFGIYPWFTFHNRYGWDPFFAYYNSYYAVRDPLWRQRLIADHRFRSEHPESRPPRTFAAAQRLAANGRIDQRLVAAKPLSQATGLPNMRLERLGQAQREAALTRAQELRRVHSQRLEREARAMPQSAVGARTAPRTVEHPRSPIVGPRAGAQGITPPAHPLTTTPQQHLQQTVPQREVPRNQPPRETLPRETVPNRQPTERPRIERQSRPPVETPRRYETPRTERQFQPPAERPRIQREYRPPVEAPRYQQPSRPRFQEEERQVNPPRAEPRGEPRPTRRPPGAFLNQSHQMPAHASAHTSARPSVSRPSHASPSGHVYHRS